MVPRASSVGVVFTGGHGQLSKSQRFLTHSLRSVSRTRVLCLTTTVTKTENIYARANVGLLPNVASARYLNASFTDGYQPYRNGQAAGAPPKDGLGYGEPSEDPFVLFNILISCARSHLNTSLFVNIVAPPSFSGATEGLRKYPVKVYIHGG